MKRFYRSVAMLLCFSALVPLLSACGSDVTKQTETEEIQIVSQKESETEETVKMKNLEIVFARGYWLTEKDGYDGNSGESLKYISTQKFTRDTLPCGSVINSSSGYGYRLTKWSSFPEDGTVFEVSDPKYLIGDDFWDGIEYAAIDFSLSETDKDKTDFSDAIKIDVPEETKTGREFTWNNDGTLSVLAVGNSFSADALEYVYQIAKSAGVEEVIIGNLFYSGCRISQHFGFWNKKSEVYDYYLNTNGTWKVTSGTSFEAAFGEYDWDFISFQESAQELQTKESNYNKLGKLIAMAKEHCPDAKLVYHMPWSNPHANYQMKTEKMYNDCMTALRRIIEDYGFDEIITTGTAIQNARTSSIDNDSLLRDGWHLSLGIGRYTASLTFFTQITGISVKDIGFAPRGISDTEKLIAVESAENARKNPRIVTQSEYRD